MRLGKKKKTYTCFVDFSKAFDSVYRHGLWIRLWQCGIKDKIWKILRSIYEDTTETININGERSHSFQCIRHCCPLSPDLLSCLLFAHDLVLLAESAQDLQLLITQVKTYCCLWKMKINTKKKPKL
eukprot:Lithocolla_globosa_v1_NODE_1888_length_2272_cov_7.484438.p1 type:complete len:126 gc:universal NODE_1888_length_2272_cov_7.484438:1318-941(-)